MPTPAETAQAGAAERTCGVRADLCALVVLGVVAIALRGWQLTHTEVASRDSIGYIRIAWQLEHGDWQKGLREAQQHPGYPLVLLAISLPVRHFLHADLATQMQYSAQLASSLASILLVIPMYYLGRELFNRRVGFWTAMFFQCLPSSGRGMADGLSEPFFLLTAATTLAFACAALRTGRTALFALCGVCGGLAYLTRPEGGILVAATGLVLLVMLALGHRLPRRRVLLGGVVMIAAAGIVAAPYMIAIGGITAKPTAVDIIKSLAAFIQWLLGTPTRYASGGTPFAVWWTDHENSPAARTWWSVVSLLEVLSKGFFYIFWAPALVGLWWFGDRFRKVPGTWVLLLVCTAVGLLLYRVAHLKGYLSDRHTLLIVLIGSYFAVAAMLRLGEILTAGAVRLWPALRSRRWVSGPVVGVVILLAIILGLLPRTLEGLHAERTGFRTAGYWLAQHTLPGDPILDPYCWANYYAGRVFSEGATGLPCQSPPMYYLAIEKSANKHTRLPEHIRAEQMVKTGIPREIHRFDVKRGQDRASVVIYEMSDAEFAAIARLLSEQDKGTLNGGLGGGVTAAGGDS
jgi:4-amino-4-deoxy-L-arabinose transferase-like glycosyltransferase